jgi:hypothetical protein
MGYSGGLTSRKGSESRKHASFPRSSSALLTGEKERERENTTQDIKRNSHILRLKKRKALE